MRNNRRLIFKIFLIQLEDCEAYIYIIELYEIRVAPITRISGQLQGNPPRVDVLDYNNS